MLYSAPNETETLCDSKMFALLHLITKAGPKSM
jgi:hypothetical protein